jgi:hypothetical protein
MRADLCGQAESRGRALAPQLATMRVVALVGQVVERRAARDRPTAGGRAARAAGGSRDAAREGEAVAAVSGPERVVFRERRGRPDVDGFLAQDRWQ